MQPGVPHAGFVEPAARAAIERLLARYGHAIDNDALEEWPDFFLEDGRYEITTRDNHSKGRPIGVVYCDSRGMMQDRITALRKAIVYEPHVYRHITGFPLIEPAPDGGYSVESSFQVLRTASDGSVMIFGCGRCLDEIVLREGRALFRSRIVILDSPRIDTLLVIPL